MDTISHPQTDEGRKLEETIDQISLGDRDPEVSRQALERLRQGREEMRQRVGTVDLVVPMIREIRE